MRKFVLFFALFSLFVAGETRRDECTPIAIDTYDIVLSLRVPQVFSNTTSQGYRKYKRQLIKGKMDLIWMSDGTFGFDFYNLVNKTFKVGGENVRYTGIEGREIAYPRFNWIGNNKTDYFKKPCICFYIELEPSYSKGGNTEDNSFYLMMSGTGSSVFMSQYKSRIATYFSGYAAGTQGCGCNAYGHKSPTRKATIMGPMYEPEDVVATFGQWKARWKTRKYL